MKKNQKWCRINNRFTDQAKIVIEIDGKVSKTKIVDLASDTPSEAQLFIKKHIADLKDKNWECYISLLHF